MHHEPDHARDLALAACKAAGVDARFAVPMTLVGRVIAATSARELAPTSRNAAALLVASGHLKARERTNGGRVIPIESIGALLVRLGAVVDRFEIRA